jgi:hypothetical protein
MTFANQGAPPKSMVPEVNGKLFKQRIFVFFDTAFYCNRFTFLLMFSLMCKQPDIAVIVTGDTGCSLNCGKFSKKCEIMLTG